MNDDKWFLKYCNLHPIDIDIIRKLDVGALYKLAENSQLICSVNNVYVIIDTEWHSYLLQFKDEAAYKLYSDCLNLYKPIGKFSFNYDEFDISINNHNLKYALIIHGKNQSAYTINKNNRRIVFITGNDCVMVNESINRILTNFHINGFDDTFKFIHTIPYELNQVVVFQRVLMQLK